MKAFVVCIMSLGLFVGSPIARADSVSDVDLSRGNWNWSCGNNSLHFSIVQGQIFNLKIDKYLIIENGRQLEDHRIGDQVFDVRVGEIRKLDGRLVRFSTRLSDYSDQHSWEVTFIANDDYRNHNFTYSISLVSTYRSSDGDDLLHPTAEVFRDCSVRNGMTVE